MKVIKQEYYSAKHRAQWLVLFDGFIVKALMPILTLLIYSALFTKSWPSL